MYIVLCLRLIYHNNTTYPCNVSKQTFNNSYYYTGMWLYLVLYWLPQFRSVPIFDYFRFQTVDISIWYQLLQTYTKLQGSVKINNLLQIFSLISSTRLFNYLIYVNKPILPNNLLFLIVIWLIGTTLVISTLRYKSNLMCLLTEYFWLFLFNI